MAEMEKEGRPPENKRSRKPAHPVKREINEEMKVTDLHAVYARSACEERARVKAPVAPNTVNDAPKCNIMLHARLT